MRTTTTTTQAIQESTVYGIVHNWEYLGVGFRICGGVGCVAFSTPRCGVTFRHRTRNSTGAAGKRYLALSNAIHWPQLFFSPQPPGKLFSRPHVHAAHGPLPQRLLSRWTRVLDVNPRPRLKHSRPHSEYFLSTYLLSAYLPALGSSEVLNLHVFPVLHFPSWSPPIYTSLSFSLVPSSRFTHLSIRFCFAGRLSNTTQHLMRTTARL